MNYMHHIHVTQTKLRRTWPPFSSDICVMQMWLAESSAVLGALEGIWHMLLRACQKNTNTVDLT